MKNWTLTCFSSVIVVGTLVVINRAMAEPLKNLGHSPLCEASTAIILPCPGSQKECLLVGDDEQGKDLFLFSIQDGTISAESQKALNLQLTDHDQLSDIEAMANFAPNEILVFGSHSRNDKCRAKERRRQFARIRLSSKGATLVKKTQSKKIRCDRLFGEISSGDSVLKAACEEIDRAEKKARKLETKLEIDDITKKQAKQSCNKITSFNAEGAVAIPGTNGPAVWIGLRAPLLAEHPDQPEYKNLAILLRMKDLESYEFDRVALLNLNGRGVRELAYAEGSVWVIAGPSKDQKETFQLRRFAKDDLESHEILEPDLIDTLPTASEGLAIIDKTAYVFIEGHKGRDYEVAKDCKEPSKYKKIELQSMELSTVQN